MNRTQWLRRWWQHRRATTRSIQQASAYSFSSLFFFPKPSQLCSFFWLQFTSKLRERRPFHVLWFRKRTHSSKHTSTYKREQWEGSQKTKKMRHLTLFEAKSGSPFHFSIPTVLSSSHPVYYFFFHLPLHVPKMTFSFSFLAIFSIFVLLRIVFFLFSLLSRFVAYMVTSSREKYG